MFERFYTPCLVVTVKIQRLLMKEEPSKSEAVFKSDKEIADTLKAYWEHYMRVVDLTITLATGTFLVFANIVFSDKLMPQIRSASLAIKITGIAAAVFLGLGIFSAVAWRMLSLTWMEIECIGRKDEANRYLRSIGVVENDIYAFQTGPTKLKRRMWNYSKYASGAFILVSWILLLVFAIGVYSAMDKQNKPDVDQARSISINLPT
jgi:hypothetical protein